ncbi:Hsp70 family protein [uncultured Sphingomonas sp.]|uniref:Hsp70 family protein n=1 Tax=uncultured Sphingomonas sp. TaxID=158754 RepID=UPI0030F820D7
MARALGLDFGTTNTVVALAEDGEARLVEFTGKKATGAVFRSALCFWEDEQGWNGVASEAGPWAIAEYLEAPLDSRFVQSFKTVAASPLFERTTIFNRQMRFEDLGRLLLQKLVRHAGGQLDDRPARVIVGRPVEYAGARPDEALAKARYDLMLREFGVEVHYVYEPLGAAHSFASRLTEPATILVADFGGGTTDFSLVRVAAPGAERRCVPLASTGVGIAGDRFDQRIVSQLVLPLLGKGGQYRSFGKVLDIPGGFFNDVADWSRLAMMRNRRTLEELRKLQRDALDPDAIGRMIALVEEEQGFPLYDAVGRLKRALSSADHAEFAFEGGGIRIAADVTRADFQRWIAEDLARIEAALDAALARGGVEAGAIDRVFLTGGSSLIPAIRAIFDRRFGAERIATGGELTSIAHGLALIGAEPDITPWAA